MTIIMAMASVASSIKEIISLSLDLRSKGETTKSTDLKTTKRSKQVLKDKSWVASEPILVVNNGN
jgi:hypothetical protein